MSSYLNFSFATLFCAAFILLFNVQGYAQTAVISAPEYVNAEEEFVISIEFNGDKKVENASFKWNTTPPAVIKDGPAISTSTHVSIMNGKRTVAYSTSYTYHAITKESGAFMIDSVDVDGVYGNIESIELVHSTLEHTTVHNGDPKTLHEPSYVAPKKISSIGKRTDNLDVLKYDSKTALLTNVMGWCYNTSSNKWSGNKNFIHSSPGAGAPSLLSPVCYGLQSCKYSGESGITYILKWKGISSFDKSSYSYMIFSEAQYNALRELDSKGIIMEVGYTIPFDKPKSDDQEIRDVLSQHVLIKFAARLDDDVVRFNYDEHKGTISTTEEGFVDFSVESNESKMQGYFEISISDWRKLF